MKTQRNRVLAAAIAGVLAVAGAVGATGNEASVAAPVAFSAGDPPDQLVFKDGRVIKGRVLEETETQVRFLVIVAGIEGEQTYNKADLLAIDRGPEGGETKAAT
ncbi:MAG: hypothetical protein ACF8LK_10240, partial [Phycisphaerales bacterium JB041]